MNCKDFESTVHELVSRRVTDKTKHLEALEHAGHCLWCALRLDEENKLTEKLRGFASTLQGQRAPARVEEELLQAFRERTLRTGAPILGLAGKRFWRGLSWGLAFAATVAAAWIAIFQWQRLHPRSGALPSRVASQRPLAASEISQAKQEANPGSPVAAGVAPRQVGAHAATSPDAAGSGQALERGAPPQQHLRWEVAHARTPERAALDEFGGELTTDFISLGTCDDSPCMEEATLVRVTLPAEALLAFGLGTDNDYAPESLVQADVALGSDGVPFAIRFVN